MSSVIYTTNKRPAFRRIVILPAALIFCMPFDAWALEIYSVSVDRVQQKIIVKGSGFSNPTSIMLGGVPVTTVFVNTTQLDIPFGPEVALAVMWRGSYKMILDGTIEFSVYIGAPIDDPTAPPPPPPPGGTTCPCIAGWEASGIPKDNFTFCYSFLDGTQESIFGSRSPYFIAAAFDPNDIFFDPVDPGNSVSYCALHDGTSYTVAEPVVNWSEYDDCENWLWVNICL